jgi:hypothetical protein
MDLRPAFMAAAAPKAPQAGVAHDRFHAARHPSEAVGAARKRGHAGLGAQSRDWLDGRNHRFLKPPESWKEGERCCFAGLQKKGLRVATARGPRENLGRFRASATREGAGGLF